MVSDTLKQKLLSIIIYNFYKIHIGLGTLEKRILYFTYNSFDNIRFIAFVSLNELILHLINVSIDNSFY